MRSTPPARFQRALPGVRSTRRFLSGGGWVLAALLAGHGFASASDAPASLASLEAPSLLERAFDLDEGKAQPRNAAAAAALYQQAADAGDAFAHLRLGYLKETGDGAQHDYIAARAHYQAAADAGLAEARLRLAICHLEGWGGPADRAAFVRELRAAAEAEYVPAQNILARVYLIGLGVPADRTESVRWLERAATHKDAEAQFRLGRLSERATQLALAPDLQLARTWFQLSAEQEYQAAMRALARSFLTGPRADRNWQLGQQWLTLAHDTGDPEAPYVLALTEMIHVDSPNRDADKARAWLKTASERGNSEATELLNLEASGRPLAEAMSYLLNTRFEDRYVQQQAAKISKDAATRPPEIYRVVRPIYPQALMLTKTSGEVMVDFSVDTTGRVTRAYVVSTSHPLFSARALEAVNQWRFHPAKKDGVIVNTHMRVPIFFAPAGADISGVDGVLSQAYQYAQRLGAEVLADATDLARAVPVDRLPRPVQPDGKAFPAGSHAMILLVLDAQGRPQRGHILDAKPEILGPTLLNLALTASFKPRLVNNEAVASNGILTFATSR